jgi:hypothetical protein
MVRRDVPARGWDGAGGWHRGDLCAPALAPAAVARVVADLLHLVMVMVVVVVMPRLLGRLGGGREHGGRLDDDRCRFTKVLG